MQRPRRLLAFCLHPVVLFAFLLIGYGTYQGLSVKPSAIIRSDGRGYYAYLPAFCFFYDSGFDASLKAEQNYRGPDAPLYLMRRDGKMVNKYFPGVAVLQAPFFGLATLFSTIAGEPLTGYSDTYSYFFLIGGLCYALLGLWFFYAVLCKLFPEQRPLISWLIPLLYVATPLLFYTTHAPGFSHVYSFFLFGWMAWQLLRTKENPTLRRFLFLGVNLALIALVRPTNLLVVLAIPLLFQNKEATISFFVSLFANKARFLRWGIFGFLPVIFIQLFLWKWESGHWLVWSYSGEGFRWFHPHLWETLFSFRIGFLVHSPVMLLVLAGFVLWFRKNRFVAGWWLFYLLVLSYVISAWWCWDYESAFGNRPFTEHLIFLLLPLIPLITRYYRPAILIISLFAVIGIIRLWSYDSGYMTNQRFTANNYFRSLAVWNSRNFDRWHFTRSCRPYGHQTESKVLFASSSEINAEGTEFLCNGETSISSDPTVRYYYRVSMEKKINDAPLREVYLVVDAWNSASGQRYYYATELVNDRLEGQQNWAPIMLEGIVHDNLGEYDHLKIYVWNLEKQSFSLRKVNVELLSYKS